MLKNIQISIKEPKAQIIVSIGILILMLGIAFSFMTGDSKITHGTDAPVQDEYYEEEPADDGYYEEAPVDDEYYEEEPLPEVEE